MILPLGKVQDLELDNLTRREVHVSDFIPYACHVDKHTLLTKNGELLQTIKITGFTFEAVGSKKLDLRATIRKALLNNLESNNYAIWFHTIRRKKNLDPGGNYPEGFPRMMHQAWCDRHDWAHKYINELYVTIVREGETAQISKPKMFMRALFPRSEARSRYAYLNQAHEQLEQAVQGVMKTLEEFGAKRLGIIEREGTYYSEPMEFLGKIINLEEVPMPLSPKDISEVLPSQKVAFGFNALEVKGKQTGQHFGAVLTVKEYHEIDISALDEFLQLPQEFIVSQCVDFINRKKAVSGYKYQKYITDLSGDRELAKLSGIEEIVSSDRGSPIDYGEQQLSIFLLADSLDELENSVANSVSALQSLGIIAFREDLRMEHCYWAQLPGNFSFISRLRPINTARIGGFASLYNFPAGKAVGNHWGPMASVFYTAMGTPYFFSFHDGDNGHTTLIGPYGSGKTVLMNFLVSETQKFQPRMFYFDHDRGSEIFLRALGGKMIRIAPNPTSQSTLLNPFRLPDSQENRNFLKLWIHSLVSLQEVGFTGGDITAQEMELLYQAVDHVFTLPENERQIAHMIPFLENHRAEAAVEALAPWHGKGRFARLFDNPEDQLNFNQRVTGFDMSEIEQVPGLPIPVVLYLFHRINQSLDGAPTVLVLDEAWSLLNHPILSEKVNGWLEFLKSRNTIAILATESVEHASQAEVSKNIFEQAGTQIYLPNEEAGDVYRTVFNLSKDEFDMLNFMESESREFMLKHGGHAVVCELNLGGMDELIAVLSANPEHIATMEQLINQHGEEPGKWLPHFLDQMQA